MPRMKYWEIIADRLHAEGWSYGIAEHLTKHGVLFCNAHRDGKRFIFKADNLLTAFLSLERDAIEFPLAEVETAAGVAPGVVQYTSDPLFHDLWLRPALPPPSYGQRAHRLRPGCADYVSLEQGDG